MKPVDATHDSGAPRESRETDVTGVPLNQRDDRPSVETWSLDHPTFGRLEAHIGWFDQLRALDPGFPNPALVNSNDTSRSDDKSVSSATPSSADATEATETAAKKIAEYQAKAAKVRERMEKRLGPQRAERLREWAIRDRDWHARGLIIMRNGRVIARLSTIRNAKIAMTNRSLEAGQATTQTTVNTGDRFHVEVAGPSRFVTGILVKSGDEVVAFDPPPGSKGADRLAAMETSPWKRVAFPVMAGMGKAGWAIFALIIGPIVTRILAAVLAFVFDLIEPIISWLRGLIPDFSIPWPHISWPQISLPKIPWPHIDLPDIDLPHIPWPHWHPPHWVVWLAEHPKTWMPVIVALGLGIMAVRNQGKSERTKAEWNRQQRERELARLASALREVERMRRKNSGSHAQASSDAMPKQD